MSGVDSMGRRYTKHSSWERKPLPDLHKHVDATKLIFPLTIFRNVLCFSLYKIAPPIRRRRFCFCADCSFRITNLRILFSPQFLAVAAKSFRMCSSEHP